ncbi:polyisoprenoid-binding protein YceI [Herbihabitans rhizosphaerae]|uniref:Polyisoprenoid-binding protein YceI n=1 Tax=Herbihabitans rhizosphaerae TaxID=1872711 RepID=A0A4Q7KGJ3_9PSEU|nr:YceI family protein [Herbihabitans rhizosphaerae]RZS34383.1 polyisoprenoid-binding protein YceI [Herbihabitans rhizosphaerae]
MTTTIEIPGYITGTWDIDPTHSDVSFTVRHLGVSKVRGHFATFSGTIVTAENPLDSSVTATIEPASVDTRNEQRDGHLRSEDFLDVENHKELTFHSTGVRADGEAFKVDGELSLRGVTKTVTLDLELNGFADHPALEGAKVAGFSAATEISRKDFGITGGQAGVMVGDKITILLEIEASLRTDA